MGEMPPWQHDNRFPRALLLGTGFEDAWERAICRGRELSAERTLAEQGVGEQSVVVTVRRVLVADGWKVGGGMHHRAVLLLPCRAHCGTLDQRGGGVSTFAGAGAPHVPLHWPAAANTIAWGPCRSR